MSIRLVLADDHQVVVDGLRGLLDNEPDMEVVGQAANGRQAVAIAKELVPDVVILDVTMPDLNGVCAAREIARRVPGAKVLALSMHSGKEFVQDMLQAGAAGYVVKSAPAEEVVEAVRMVAAGGTYVSAEVAEYAEGSGAVERAPRLSDREREVLQLVAEGLTSKEIGARLHVSSKTVDWHRQSIMDKLGIRSIAELTKYAIRQGITPLER